MRLFDWRTRIFTAAVAMTGAVLLLPGAPAQAAPAGAVIEAAAQGELRGIPNAYIIDYWTTRSNGEPVQASGALYLPDGPAPAGGWPIMAYNHGTSGLGMGCGGQTDITRINRGPEAAMLRKFVDQGFAVVAPDYLGLGRFDTGPHPYLEVRSEASATIDLVKAARAARPGLSRTWSVIGFSQGGHAALSAAHLQASTAPDLDFRGVIAVDPASDVEKVMPFIGPYVPGIPGENGAAVNGFVVSMLVGLRETHPELDLNGYLTPRGREVLDRASTMCFGDMMKAVGDISIGEMVNRPLGDERFHAVIDEYMTLPTSGYDAPILLLLNATDITVPSPLHAGLAAQLAANGVAYETVVGTGQHTEVSPQMWAAVDRFTARVLSTPVTP
ncbi:alpha/beta fold hydrolase [Nocardia crassostreae]|uniref:alpha/beta fold hydrolase n=1 Tax=Nocardia crassostreae TaxID=53428 RepID=UPI000829A552|nr:lipase family protein [Nocardia crassostreae]